MKTIFTLIFILPAILMAQYNPEIDARGNDDVTDGGELQLATPSLGHFIRMFSGRDGDPNPFLYFSDADTFSITTGNNDFGGFTNLLRLHPNGGIDTRWGVGFYHYNPSWMQKRLPYLNKGWSGPSWDFMYLGSTGNRNNNVQGAIMLSHRKGIEFGKGHNSGDSLSRVDMVIDSGGVVRIKDLEGMGDSPVIVDSDGKLRRGGVCVCPYVLTPFTDETLYQGGGYELFSGNRIRITVEFSHRMDPSSFIYGSSIRIYGDNGSSSGANLIWANGNTKLTIETNDEYTDFCNSLVGPFFLEIVSSGANAVSGLNGVQLDGDRDGCCGGPYLIRFAVLI